MEQSEDAAVEVALPQAVGIYPAGDVASEWPLHVDDALGWVLECYGHAYLIRRDAGSGHVTFGRFSSTEQVQRLLNRLEDCDLLRPMTPAVWDDRLTTDDDAFDLSDKDLARYLDQLRAARDAD